MVREKNLREGQIFLLQDELKEEGGGFLLKMERYLRVLKMISPNWLGHIQLQQEQRQKEGGRVQCYDFEISYF